MNTTVLHRPLADSALSLTRRPSPELFFEQCVKRTVQPGDRLLDAGCGLGKFFSFDFAKEIGCQITGVDVQQDLALNPNLHYRVQADLITLPFSNESFDVITCRLVVEHLADPAAALNEFHRVLKPGGRLAIFTPNLLHYFGAAARLTPHWFHLWFNSRIRGFDHDDIFRTHYRASTQRRLNTLLFSSGFSRADVTLIEGAPDVLAFNSFLYGLGTIYEGLVKRFDLLCRFRMNIIAVAYKP